MHTDHSRLKELFIAACDLPPGEQTVLINKQCADDPALRRALEKLLHNDQSDDGILADDDLARGVQVHVDADDPPVAPERISRYRIKRLLGEGGMGLVWLAEQDNPRRDVAVKVIRSGFMSRELQRRFELEAAVLGRLQHPGIAQVHEAGMFDDGSGAKPFFAMEYVDGLPLNEFVRVHKLAVRDRLNMFMKICDAVQHAHQRSVIHRDLKPANILVTTTGQPKILDFGVARATDSDVQVSTLQTNVGQLIGTLPYMSPEQVTGRGQDVDTRSDVYALGVILYELLAERLPYDLKDRSIINAARIISEDEPAPLSTINRAFRGDLNTIVRKALEKEPERRYQSALELAADVKRYLSDEPIFARPATTVYQLRKFARRNKAIVAGVAVAFLALAVGVVSTTIGMVHAQSEADRANSLNDFMRDILVSISPDKANPDVKLVDVLRDASDSVDTRFANHPENRNQINALLGDAFAQLSVYPESLPHLKNVYEFNRDQFGKTDARTLHAAAAYLRSLGHAGHIATALSVGNSLVDAMNDAQRNSREALQLRRNLANAASIRAKTADAARNDIRQMLDVARRSFGDHDLLSVQLANDLAVMLVGDITRGQSEHPIADAQEAADLFRFALDDPAVYQGDVIEEARTRLNLADALTRLDELDEAEFHVQRIFELGAKTFGENHAIRGRAYRTLADIHWRKDEPRLAAECWVKQAEVDRKRDGDNSVFSLSTMSDALPYLEAGGLNEKGEEYARVASANMGAAHGDIADLHTVYLARFLSAQGKFTEADPLFEQLAHSDQMEINSDFTCIYHLFLGEHQLAQGDIEEARQHMHEAQRIRAAMRDDAHPSRARVEDAVRRASAADPAPD